MPVHVDTIVAYVNELAGLWIEDRRVYDPEMLDLLEHDNPAFFEWWRATIGEFPRL